MTEPKIKVVVIDPAYAHTLLANNDRNRPMDHSLVRTYARLMTVGKWTFVGDPIRVSTTGRLLDGQNRLSAIVQSDTTQQFVLITNLPDDSQDVMDVGKKRSPSDVFSMNDVPNAPAAAAVTNLVMRYDLGNVLDTKYRITVAELLAYYQDPANTTLIDNGTAMGQSVKRMLPLSPAVVGTIHVAASRISDPYAVNVFFEGLIHGHNLTRESPIAALRNWVIRRHREDLRVARTEYFYLLIKVWNAWVQGEEMFRAQLPKGGLTSSDQIPALLPAAAPDVEPVTEDNPAVTPYSRTRKENEARKGKKTA